MSASRTDAGAFEERGGGAVEGGERGVCAVVGLGAGAGEGEGDQRGDPDRGTDLS
jgi:hypothetical protein